MITDSKILKKALIRTHTRKTPSGGVTTVREHEDIRQRKQEKPTKTRTAGTVENTPEKVGKYLIGKKVPISANNGDKKQSGIAISKAPNGKNIVIQYADWENKGDQNTAMNTVRTHLNAVGLDISEYKGTGRYYVHKKGVNFFGHGDLPVDKNKAKETDDDKSKRRDTTAEIMDMLNRSHGKEAEPSKTKEPQGYNKIEEKTLKLSDLEVDEAGLAIARSTFMWNKNPTISNKPISVVLNKKTNKYHIEDGYHRYVKAKKDGDNNIKAIVYEKKKTKDKTAIDKQDVSDDKLTVEAKKHKSVKDFISKQKRKFKHETDAQFDKFDINKIGSGQGQAFLGRGIYLKDDSAVFFGKFGDIKMDAYLTPNAKIFEIKDSPKGKYRDNFVEYAVKNNLDGGLAQQRIKDGLSLNNLLPRDIFKRNPAIIDRLKKDGYDGLYSDGEMVIYNDKVIKTKKQLTDIWNKANPDKGSVKSIMESWE